VGMPDAGRGLQPRLKCLHALITFETLNVKDGVANPVPLGCEEVGAL
jgi:hypothetical protein